MEVGKALVCVAKKVRALRPLGSRLPCGRPGKVVSLKVLTPSYICHVVLRFLASSSVLRALGGVATRLPKNTYVYIL